MLPEDQKRILGYFIEEAKDHLNTIEQGLLNLQTTLEDSEMMNEVFRAAHSVKGGAAMLGLHSIQRTSHRMEDFFKLLKETPVRTDRTLESMLLQIFDGLQEQLEQLQGPFGLTDDQAQAIMATLEPVFTKADTHLQTLVKAAPAPTPAIRQPVPAVVTANPAAYAETSALQLVFRSDVPALLKDMLTTFKQPDGTASRQELTRICQRLQSLGEQFELDQWCILAQAAGQAVTNLQQTYRALAPIVIRDLKHCQEMVLAGNSNQVVPSNALLDLLPLPYPEADDQALTDAMAFEALLAETLDNGDGEADLIDLFGMANDDREAASLLDQAEPSLGQLPQPTADPETASWLEGMDDFEAMAAPSTSGSTPPRSRTGPEVGAAELNSLADLFESNPEGLDQIWEEEDLAEVSLTGFTEDADSSDWSQDFADLLQADQASDPSANPVDDMASLFGYDLDNGPSDDSSIDVSDQGSEVDVTAPASDQPAFSLSLAPEPDAAASVLEDLETAEIQGDLDEFFDFSTPSSSLPVTSPEGLESDDFFSPSEVSPSPNDSDDDFEFDLDVASDPQGLDFGAEITASALAEESDQLSGEDFGALFEDPLFNDSSQDEALPEDDISQAVATSDSPSARPEPGAESNFDLFDDDDDPFGELILETSSAFAPGETDDLFLDQDTGDLGDSWLADASFPPPEDEDRADVAVETETSFSAETEPDVASLDLFSLDQGEAAPGEESPLDSGLSDSGLEQADTLPPDEAWFAGGNNDSDDDNFTDLDALLDASQEPVLEFLTPELVTPEPVTPEPENLESENLAADSPDLDRPDAEPDSVESFHGIEPLVAGGATDDESDDEFGDLEKLLEEADQLGGSSPALVGRRTTPIAAGRRAPRRNSGVSDQTMRVSVNHLDNLSNLVGELVVNRNSLEQDQDRLRQFLDNLLSQVQQLNDVGQRMRDLYERSLLESSLMSNRQSFALRSSERSDSSHATGATFDALEMDRFTGFHTLSQEMIELIVRVREASSDIEFTIDSTDQIARQFRQVTTQLQEGLNKARMVPFGQTADRLPRAVRDISLKCGKEAKLVVEGRDTLIDKMILERLYDPMTHLVNNAITHGIESPEERLALGKPAEGTITIRAFYQGNQTVIYIADDGGGINPILVKTKAIQQGLMTADEAQTVSEIELYDLLFLPGFTTRDQADDFSGRGVGMDVVRTALADIRGSIAIESEVHKGTSFTIRLPLTLSITKALSCVNNQARIAFPMDGVEDMFDVPKARTQANDQGQSSILWRDTLLPFRPLGDLLQFNRGLGRGRVYGGPQDEDMMSIVVLRSASTFFALQVDQVIGEQEIVIKQLEGPVPKPIGIAGATVLGDGRVMPIADVLELIDLSTGRMRRDASASLWPQPELAEPIDVVTPSEPTVLIVDDSITVRELLSMSFNKFGYRVEQARDGQEAWEKLRSGLPCDLVFCDIEMPRMDGLELLSRMQKDHLLRQIPIAMLTSRGADRHRQMAIDLGAKGYFTKPYLEEMLLDAAQRMLKGENMVAAKERQ